MHVSSLSGCYFLKCIRDDASGFSNQEFWSVSMSFLFSLKAVASAGAVASIAVIGMVGAAIAQDRTSLLYEGQSTTMEAYLLANESVYATCDSKCSDIDMMLYTTQGAEVSSDFELDDNPVVTAPFEGVFLVKVSMPVCSHALGCEVFVSSEHGF